MQRRDALKVMAGLPVAAAAAFWPLPIQADLPVSRGFDHTLQAIANGEEIARQPDLWVFEVSFKPMRMVWADVTDPVTRERKRSEVWYLAYRAVNRELSARVDTSNTTPVNALDPLPGASRFIPEFTLLTYEKLGSEIPDSSTLDVVLPEAMSRINRTERRYASDPEYRNTVKVVQPLPQPIAQDEQNPEWIYGIATWPSINPDTDFFTVVMRGFSNGYEVRQDADGQPVVYRKSIVQKFTKRGDRFDPTQAEFALEGPPRWVYLPDPPVDE